MVWMTMSSPYTIRNGKISNRMEDDTAGSLGACKCRRVLARLLKPNSVLELANTDLS
jgi:hypothetical protein